MHCITMIMPYLWYVIRVLTQRVLRDISTGAIETRISNQKTKNESNQTRNRKQSRRNEETVKNYLSFFIKTYKKNKKKFKI